jgi:four helix bundle protein
MRDFRKLEIWKQGISLVKETYLLIDQLPSNEKYGLKSQMSRAAVSIPANIAEGCSRSSEIEFKRYLEMSIGSSFELETDLVVVQVMEFVDVERVNKLILKYNQLQQKINALISILIKSINKNNPNH